MSKKKVKVINIPAKFRGKWIAWDANHTTVVASGESLSEVRKKAIKKGEPKPWMYKVPEENEFYGGGAFVS